MATATSPLIDGDEEEIPGGLLALVRKAAQSGAATPPNPQYTPVGAKSQGEEDIENNVAGKQHLADLVAQQQQNQQQTPGGSIKSRLLRMAAAAAPLAALPFVGGGGPGAAAGIAEGVGAGEQGIGNDIEKRRQEQITKQSTLAQQIEQEKKAQEQAASQQSIEGQRVKATEEGLTLRARMGEEAETGRNNRLVQTIQGQNDRNANTVEGANKRTQDTIAGQNTRQQTSLSSAQDLEKLRQQGRMQLEQARSETQKDIAQLRASIANDPNRLTPQMKGMVQQAQALLPEIDRIDGSIDAVASRLGPLAGRWNEAWAGGVGANDPDFVRFKDDTEYLASGVALAHARGRMSNQIFDTFQRMFEAGKQDPANMHAAMQVARQWMGDYANLPQTLGQHSAGVGQGAGVGSGAPQQLSNFSVNPQTKERIGWNGTAWVPAPRH